MKAGVFGAGSFGSVLAKVLDENKLEVKLFTKDDAEAEHLKEIGHNPFIKEMEFAKTIEITADYSLAQDLDLIVIVVPSKAIRNLLDKLTKYLDDQIIVIATKGIEGETQKSAYEILKEEYNVTNPVVILSGPTHAEELAFGKYTTIVSTSASKEAREVVQKVFSRPYLRVYTNSDVRGVEILGATKNVLAIAAGVCDSHAELGDNAKAALLTRGLRELKIIGELEGAQSDTFYGLTGMGDLIVTATSVHSRNRKFGELLGKGLSKEEAIEEIQMVVEGIYSVDGIYELMTKNDLQLPIITGIYQVLHNEYTVEELIENLLKRELKDE